MARGETARLIELAQSEARRRRHALAEPTHLLAVLLAVREHAEMLHRKSLDPNELRERLEEHFAAAEARGGYRDGADAAASPLIDRVIARMGKRRWLTMLPPRMTVLDALLLEPSVAAVVFELRRGGDYRYVMMRAQALAILSRHASIGIEHLLRALVDLRSFVETVERAGGDALSLRAHLERALDRPTPHAEEQPVGVPVLEPAVRRVIGQNAFQSEVTAPGMTVRQLCVELAREEESAPVWAAAKTTREAFVHAILVPQNGAAGLLR